MLFSYGFPCVSGKMNSRRTSASRVQENNAREEISPKIEEVSKVSQGAQDDQVPNVRGGTNSDIREALFS